MHLEFRGEVKAADINLRIIRIEIIMKMQSPGISGGYLGANNSMYLLRLL